MIREYRFLACPLVTRRRRLCTVSKGLATEFCRSAISRPRCGRCGHRRSRRFCNPPVLIRVQVFVSRVVRCLEVWSRSFGIRVGLCLGFGWWDWFFHLSGGRVGWLCSIVLLLAGRLLLVQSLCLWETSSVDGGLRRSLQFCLVTACLE